MQEHQRLFQELPAATMTEDEAYAVLESAPCSSLPRIVKAVRWGATTGVGISLLWALVTRHSVPFFLPLVLLSTASLLYNPPRSQRSPHSDTERQQALITLLPRLDRSALGWLLEAREYAQGALRWALREKLLELLPRMDAADAYYLSEEIKGQLRQIVMQALYPDVTFQREVLAFLIRAKDPAVVELCTIVAEVTPDVLGDEATIALARKTLDFPPLDLSPAPPTVVEAIAVIEQQRLLPAGYTIRQALGTLIDSHDIATVGYLAEGLGYAGDFGTVLRLYERLAEFLPLVTVEDADLFSPQARAELRKLADAEIPFTDEFRQTVREALQRIGKPA